jgi:hypothetical protein
VLASLTDGEWRRVLVEDFGRKGYRDKIYDDEKNGDDRNEDSASNENDGK